MELEAVFTRLEANILPLIARFKGESEYEGGMGDEIKKGDVVFVPKLEGEARVESVTGDGKVVVIPSDPKLAMATALGWGSKSKGQVFRYRRDEVQLVRRGTPDPAAAEKS